MSDRNTEDIIGALYDLVQDARSMPLAADKCIVERDKVLDMLDEIIAFAGKQSRLYWHEESGLEEKRSFDRLKTVWQYPGVGLEGIALYVNDLIAKALQLVWHTCSKGKFDVFRESFADLALSLDVLRDVPSSKRYRCIVTHDILMVDCN